MLDVIKRSLQQKETLQFKQEAQLAQR